MLLTLIKKLINHFGIATLDQGIASAASLFSGLFLMKVWDLTVFGQLSLIFVIGTLLLEVQKAAIVAPMMSFGPKTSKAEWGGYFSSLSILNVIATLTLSLVTALIILISGAIFPKWDIASFWWMSGVFMISRLFHEYYRRKFFVIERPLVSLMVTIVRSSLLTFGLIVLNIVLEDMSVWDVLCLYTVSHGSSSFVGWLYSQKQALNLKVLKKVAADHWRFGKWLVATVGVQYATNNTLVLAAAAALGPAIAGAIQAAQYVMGVLGNFLQTLENVVPAHTARLFHENGFKTMAVYLNKIFVGLFVFTIVFVGIIVLIAPWLVPYLFGDEEYTLVVSLINGFAVFYIINSATLCLVYALRAIEKTKPVFVAYAITAALNIVLAKPLIAHFGGIGVIYGMIGFQCVIVLVYLMFIKHYKRQLS